MSAQHTPGPWRVGDYSEVVTRAGKQITVEGVALACRSTPETHANTRLIAAAPDLLEALREADKCMSGLYDGSEVQSRIRAAIAQATGETA